MAIHAISGIFTQLYLFRFKASRKRAAETEAEREVERMKEQKGWGKHGVPSNTTLIELRVSLEQSDGFF